MDRLSTDEVPVMEEGQGRIVLFTPHIPKEAFSMVEGVLKSRWIGQGPRVDEFEKKFLQEFCGSSQGVALGSGTDALHLAYILAGINSGDEVAVPVFTCTATNIPLLYIGAKPKFVDIDPRTMNIDVSHLKKVVNKKTKAIVVVHYGGFPCDMDEIQEIANEYQIPVIEDAAHSLGAKYKGRNIGEISDFTMFSFQAIKHITTGDGGFLAFKNSNLIDLAKRLRWFGIDRKSKQLGIWENDINEVGYKYQMTDISASMGLAALKEFQTTLKFRQTLLNEYIERLKSNKNVTILSNTQDDRVHAAWLFTIAVERRRNLQFKLMNEGIESNQVHYRNDKYSIFATQKLELENMNLMEDRYLCLPLHTNMTVDDVIRVCKVINEGW